MFLLRLLEPWEPSPIPVLACLVGAVLYLRGTRRLHVGWARQCAFWSGLALFYLALHTRLDYYAEHEFFMHRLQHLILHHLAPLLVMASYPGPVLRTGLPWRGRRALARIGRTRAAKLAARVLLQPAVVALAFVASVLVWLIPSVQFVAMLDVRLYTFMNWSVALTGLLYWGIVLDPRPCPPGRMRPGLRVLSPVLTMTPQIIAGAIVTFDPHELYPVFTQCGRAFTALPAVLDQSLGGLIMWVPAGLVEALGALLALRNLMRLSARKPQTDHAARRLPRASALENTARTRA